MEIADQGHGISRISQAQHYFRNCPGGSGRVHCNTHQFRTGRSQSRTLLSSGKRIFRVCIGHCLHDNRRTASDKDGIHQYTMS
jgi:hypothetical protein